MRARAQIMPEADLSLEELEELSYYDFMGYMDVPFFNIRGVGSIDRLAELCEIGKNSKVLVAGCGTSGNSCYLAQTYCCHITGIDIAENMIKKAQRMHAYMLCATMRTRLNVPKCLVFLSKSEV